MGLSALLLQQGLISGSGFSTRQLASSALLQRGANAPSLTSHQGLGDETRSHHHPGATATSSSQKSAHRASSMADAPSFVLDGGLALLG